MSLICVLLQQWNYSSYQKYKAKVEDKHLSLYQVVVIIHTTCFNIKELDISPKREHLLISIYYITWTKYQSDHMPGRVRILVVQNIIQVILCEDYFVHKTLWWIYGEINK
jgi:hypothetical protein